MQTLGSSLKTGGYFSRASKLLLVILTLVVAGLFSPGQGESAMAASLHTVHDGAASTRSAPGPLGSDSFTDASSRQDLALDALEVDVDDDDFEGERERLAGFAWHVLALPDARPLASHRMSRAQPQRDPSRFAIGHGFARGPPV